MTESLRDRIGVDVGRHMVLEDGLAWAAQHLVRYVDIQLDTGPTPSSNSTSPVPAPFANVSAISTDVAKNAPSAPDTVLFGLVAASSLGCRRTHRSHSQSAETTMT